MLKFLIFVYFLLILESICGDELEVTTKQGTLRGSFLKTWKGRNIKAYMSIPFAKPPVGELRFEPPVAAEPWHGIFDATKNDKVCTQVAAHYSDFSVMGDEDCLYLSVYVPEMTNKKERLPVLFFLHDGGLFSGSGSFYTPDFLLEEDIILVTTNYRLGALGFISTGDEVVPGNIGLKDQNMALRWVKENIANFGGDSNRITIAGESAGALSVNYQLLSPLSRGLFQGAIVSSGSAFEMWSVSTQGETFKNTKKLAKLLDCPTTPNRNMIDCLKKVDVKDIFRQDKTFAEWNIDPIIPYKPVIEPELDGAFITEHPIDIMKTGKSAKVPLMTGINTEDGAFKAAMLYNDATLIREYNEKFDQLAPITLQYELTSPMKDAVTKRIRQFYFGEKDIDENTRSELTDLFTDGWFMHGQDVLIQLHFKYTNQPIYYYLFGFRGSKSYADLFTSESHDYGVCHLDNMLYLFNLNKWKDSWKTDETDHEMIETMTHLWANFVKTGDPTPVTENKIKNRWEPVKSDELEYYFMKSAKEMTMEKNFYKERRDLWRSLPLDSRRIKMKDEL